MIASFYDDYSEGAHPEILRYIIGNNEGQQAGYGRDDYCQLAIKRLKQVFELTGSEIHFVPGGTLANIIGLTAMLQPFEGVIAADSGHINIHEAGALEAVGHKILAVNTDNGKLSPADIEAVLRSYEDEHTCLPRAVYLTQATELGTVYTEDELKAIVTYAHSKDLFVYVDGARLAASMASKATSWTPPAFGRLGVDIFSVGGTKNGGLYGEALVVQNDKLKAYFRHRIKQRGALLAKGRFIGQQFARFFAEDALWLESARHANVMAARLYNGLKELGTRFDLSPASNLIFPTLAEKQIQVLEKDFGFYRWQPQDEGMVMIRLVCSWATTPEQVDAFIGALRKCS